MSVIRVSGLRKTYDGKEALKGIDFELNAGEVFGLLGPNGAGKTTTIEILEGYRDRTAGESRFRLWSWLPRYMRWYGRGIAGRFGANR